MEVCMGRKHDTDYLNLEHVLAYLVIAHYYTCI